MKFTFKEGGAFDFQAQYERIRERLQQAVENSRMDGDAGAARGPGGAANGVGVNMENVNLDELPAYQEQGDGPLIPPTASAVMAAQESVRRSSGGVSGSVGGEQRQEVVTPVEPPPGYEEAQMATLQDEAQWRQERAAR